MPIYRRSAFTLLASLGQPKPSWQPHRLSSVDKASTLLTFQGQPKPFSTGLAIRIRARLYRQFVNPAFCATSQRQMDLTRYEFRID